MIVMRGCGKAFLIVNFIRRAAWGAIIRGQKINGVLWQFALSEIASLEVNG